MLSVTCFPTNPCVAAQLPLGELTQLAQYLVSLPSPLSMRSSCVPYRSRFVLIPVNVSVTALPLAFRRARANRDSDLPLSFHLRLALGCPCPVITLMVEASRLCRLVVEGLR